MEKYCGCTSESYCPTGRALWNDTFPLYCVLSSPGFSWLSLDEQERYIQAYKRAMDSYFAHLEEARAAFRRAIHR